MLYITNNAPTQLVQTHTNNISYMSTLTLVLHSIYQTAVTLI